MSDRISKNKQKNSLIESFFNWLYFSPFILLAKMMKRIYHLFTFRPLPFNLNLDYIMYVSVMSVWRVSVQPKERSGLSNDHSWVVI